VWRGAVLSVLVRTPLTILLFLANHLVIYLASVSRYARVPYTFTSSSSTSRPLHIRKGSVVMGRTDVLHRDPNVYPNPDELDPQRYQGAQSGGEKKVAHKSPHTALTQHYMYFGFGKHPWYPIYFFS